MKTVRLLAELVSKFGDLVIVTNLNMYFDAVSIKSHDPTPRYKITYSYTYTISTPDN